MEDQKEIQFTEILESIKEMRKVMNSSASAFEYIYQSRNIRLVFLLGGCLVLAFSLAYHILLMIYDHHVYIPANVKTIFYTIIFLSYFMLIVLRTHLTWKAGRKLKQDLSLFGLTKLVLSSRACLAILPVMILMFILPFKIFPFWPNYYYTPYIAIAAGLLFNMMGVGIRVVEFSVMGYWLLIIALAGLFIIEMPVYIAIAVSFAPAFFLFALIAYISDKGSNDDQN